MNSVIQTKKRDRSSFSDSLDDGNGASLDIQSRSKYVKESVHFGNLMRRPDLINNIEDESNQMNVEMEIDSNDIQIGGKCINEYVRVPEKTSREINSNQNDMQLERVQLPAKVNPIINNAQTWRVFPNATVHVENSYGYSQYF